MNRFDCTRSCEHNTLASMLMINHGFVSAKNDQVFTPIQQQQARDNIGAASKADIPDISGLATKAELSNLQLGLTEEQVRAIIEEYHPPKPKDQGLAKDYPGTGWYKATDTGVVYNKGVPEGETHVFSDGDPTEYISVWDKTKLPELAGRAATSNITDLSLVFGDAETGISTYNGSDLSHWDTSNVVNMNAAFAGSPYNVKGLGNWDTANVKNMSYMFTSSKFDSDISKWDTANVSNMDFLFYDTPFNQDISNWDVSNVTDMESMFFYATSFNQDLSQWCVAKISSKPPQFDVNTSKWTLPKPVWGTCPRGEDQA